MPSLKFHHTTQHVNTCITKKCDWSVFPPSLKFRHPWKQNTLCQCRKNANFECHHCQTAARMQEPIRFAMDPQRECDFFLPAKRLKSRNYRQPLQNPSENANFDCQINETPEKQNTLCQCRKNANFECHHCKTAARMQEPIRFAMDPQRECDFFCQRNDWKAEIIGNPCKTPARIQLLIANETPEKLSTLCQCRKNANFECHHCKTAARMQEPLIRFAMDPQRKCDFFLPAKRLKSRNYRQPLQNASENANFNTTQQINETPEKQNTLCQCRKNANFECHHCKTAARMQETHPFCYGSAARMRFFFDSETIEKQKL